MREHTDQLYGAILSYEGKPGPYQISYIDSLKRELDDVTKEFDQLLVQELPALNESLKAKGQQPIPPPPNKVAVNDAAFGLGTGGGDPDASGASILPVDFRLLTDAAGMQETAIVYEKQVGILDLPTWNF